MACPGKDGYDDPGHGDAGEAHGYGGRVQPTTAFLALGHGQRDLARFVAPALFVTPALFLPVVHVNQCGMPACRPCQRSV